MPWMEGTSSTISMAVGYGGKRDQLPTLRIVSGRQRSPEKWRDFVGGKTNTVERLYYRARWYRGLALR